MSGDLGGCRPWNSLQRKRLAQSGRGPSHAHLIAACREGSLQRAVVEDKVLGVDLDAHPLGLTGHERDPLEALELETGSGEGEALSADIELSDLGADSFPGIGQVKSHEDEILGVDFLCGESEIGVFEGRVVKAIPEGIDRSPRGIDVVKNL